MLLLGVGMTVAVPPLTTLVMNSAGKADAGSASGINNTVARVAGLLAIAVLGSFAVARYEARLAAALESVALAPEARQAVLDRSGELLAAELPEGVPAQTRPLLEALRRRAFVDAFSSTLAASAGLAFLAALLSLVTLRGPPRPRSTRPSPLPARPT
jgi:hypothetical protein